MPAPWEDEEGTPSLPSFWGEAVPLLSTGLTEDTGPGTGSLNRQGPAALMETSDTINHDNHTEAVGVRDTGTAG